ncbi:PHD finger-containing protein 1-like isoform X2 [Euphorbia lathyris]|uniref:PHD finger-containing protein 1-like isoform X2 n=1 Tax=Euphorbia lathyris TaxID=212925 RepID=UPI0033142E1F
MVNICLTCGDEGFSNALIFCNKCKVYSVHLYCMPEVPTDFDDVVWLCEDCEPEARKLSFLDKCSPGSVEVKKKNSGRKLKKISDRKDSSGSLNRPKVTDLEKSSSIQLDTENIKKDQEYERHIRMDNKCSTDEDVGSLEGKNAQLDLGKCHQNHNRCNNLDEVSLNAEARLLKTQNHQMVITQSPDVVEQNYAPAQPIEQPIWTGLLSIPDEHIDGMLGLVAHLSNLACSRVSNEAKSLPYFLTPELLPRSTLWPKSFAKWGPRDDSIALYFFPDSESSERLFDSLVNNMMCRDLGMRAVVENAELLIFTSSSMPMDFWRFQTKFYLWGVFRGKRSGRSAVPGEAVDGQSPISPLSNCSSGFGSPFLSLNRLNL